MSVQDATPESVTPTDDPAATKSLYLRTERVGFRTQVGFGEAAHLWVTSTSDKLGLSKAALVREVLYQVEDDPVMERKIVERTRDRLARYRTRRDLKPDAHVYLLREYVGGRLQLTLPNRLKDWLTQTADELYMARTALIREVVDAVQANAQMRERVIERVEDRIEDYQAERRG